MANLFQCHAAVETLLQVALPLLLMTIRRSLISSSRHNTELVAQTLYSLWALLPVFVNHNCEF